MGFTEIIQNLRDLGYLQSIPTTYDPYLIPALAGGAMVLGLLIYLIMRPKATQVTPHQKETPAKTTLDQPFVERLKAGMSKTRSQLHDRLSQLFQPHAKVNEEWLESIHETLYRSDVGPKTADTLTDAIKRALAQKQEAPLDWETVKLALQDASRAILAPCEVPPYEPKAQPTVVLIVGVNGVGKTTSIGKIGHYFKSSGKKVLLAAADTYRAAAIDQITVWAERCDIELIKHQSGSDPAAVAYDSVKAALSREKDLLLVDTAGRLHNKKELMEELRKIKRVMGKDLPDAPHETWLVIDATTGQNAVQQVRAFSEVTPLTGLVVTKLDGTAKGGVVLALALEFKLPIRFIGVGEQINDLQPFHPEEFIASLW